MGADTDTPPDPWDEPLEADLLLDEDLFLEADLFLDEDLVLEADLFLDEDLVLEADLFLDEDLVLEADLFLADDLPLDEDADPSTLPAADSACLLRLLDFPPLAADPDPGADAAPLDDALDALDDLDDALDALDDALDDDLDAFDDDLDALEAFELLDPLPDDEAVLELPPDTAELLSSDSIVSSEMTRFGGDLVKIISAYSLNSKEQTSLLSSSHCISKLDTSSRSSFVTSLMAAVGQSTFFS